MTNNGLSKLDSSNIDDKPRFVIDNWRSQILTKQGLSKEIEGVKWDTALCPVVLDQQEPPGGRAGYNFFG